MNKARAMLDQMMGPGRDVASKDKKNDDFMKDDCCKHYLVGFCPNALVGKKIDAILKDPTICNLCPGSFYKNSIVPLEGCSLLHLKPLKAQLDSHPDAEKLKKQYERELQKYLGKILKEADNKILEETRKKQFGKPEENEHGWVKTCEECGMTYRLAKNRPLSDGKRREQWAQGDHTLLPGDWHCPLCNPKEIETKLNFACNDKCVSCQSDRTPESKKALEEFMNNVTDVHKDVDVHKGYVKMREKFAELNVKYENDPEPERTDKRPRDVARSRSRDARKSRRDDRGEKSRKDEREEADLWRGEVPKDDKAGDDDRDRGRGAVAGRRSPSPRRRGAGRRSPSVRGRGADTRRRDDRRRDSGRDAGRDAGRSARNDSRSARRRRY